MKGANSILNYNELLCSDANAWSPSMSPKWFWTVKIIMVEYISIVLYKYNIWTGPNLKKNWPEKSNWTWQKWFRPVQNNLDCPKSFWTYRRTMLLKNWYLLCFQKSRTYIIWDANWSFWIRERKLKWVLDTLNTFCFYSS